MGYCPTKAITGRTSTQPPGPASGSPALTHLRPSSSSDSQVHPGDHNGKTVVLSRVSLEFPHSRVSVRILPPRRSPHLGSHRVTQACNQGDPAHIVTSLYNHVQTYPWESTLQSYTCQPSQGRKQAQRGAATFPMPWDPPCRRRAALAGDGAGAVPTSALLKIRGERVQGTERRHHRLRGETTAPSTLIGQEGVGI